jgi:hypothetical protein
MTRYLVALTITMLGSLTPVFAAAPPNDAVNRAVTLRSLPFVQVLDTTQATTAFRDPQCAGQGPTVWFAYRSNADQWIEANTFGSDYDTTVSVYARGPGQMLTQLACNDDVDGVQSRIRFHAQAGVTYYFMAGAFASGPGGSLMISIERSPDQTDLTLDLRITSAVLNTTTGELTVQGTASCSRLQHGFVSGQIVQKRGNSQVTAFFGAEVLCNGSARWSAVSTRPTALFGSSSGPVVFSRSKAIITGRVTLLDESTGEVSEGEAVSTLRVR